MLFALTTCFAIYFSWNRLPILASDSSTYLNFDSHRTAYYPIFLNVLMSFWDEYLFIIFIHIFIYLVSIFSLILCLMKFTHSSFVTISFGSVTSLNYLMQSFHSSILTESLTFSLVNFYIICIFKICFFRTENIFTISIFFLGLIAGSLYCLKPAMVSFIPCSLFLVFLVCYLKRLKIFLPIIALIIPILMNIIAEKWAYDLYHDKRESLLSSHMIGKAAVLSTHTPFIIPKNIGDENKEIILYLDTFFQPYQEWLETDPNPNIRRILDSQLEATAQVKGLHILKERHDINSLSTEEMISIGFEAIKSNIWSFVSISMNNYLEFWKVNSMTFAIKFQNAQLPFFTDKDLNSLVPIYSESRLDQLSFLIFFSFIFLGISSHLLFFYLIFSIVRNKKNKKEALRDEELTIFFLLLISLTNLFIICFTNTPLTRYLMPNFPALVLANILFLWSRAREK